MISSENFIQAQHNLKIKQKKIKTKIYQKIKNKNKMIYKNRKYKNIVYMEIKRVNLKKMKRNLNIKECKNQAIK